MNLWDSIKKGLEEGVLVVSEKAGDWIKSGTDVVKEKTERVSLKYEYRNIQKAIEKELTELGGIVYDLFCKNKVADIEKETQENIKKLRSLEQELKNKEKEIEALPKTFAMETIDKRNIKELRKDLETGGGTIEQIFIVEESPFLGKKLKEIQLPEDALVGAIIRNEEVIIPDGDTIFQLGDKLTLLGKREDVKKTMGQINPDEG